MAKPEQANLKGSLRLGNYLKKLRTGYGYSLRRVEERARAEGGEIDNSQLSRYEKGICYPSFDKLRVLAGVFNVSIQAFSDVVDLEEFEELKPTSTDPAPILDEGVDQMKAGNIGFAFACFERVLDLLEEEESPDPKLAGKARISRAAALSRLGKLSLAERELREALRDESLGRELQSRALLALANIHSDQGDQFLAELEAERAFHYADTAQLDSLAARSMHTLARVMFERGSYARAIECYREAAARYSDCGVPYEEIRVRIQLGDTYVAMGKTREGVRIIKAGLHEAHTHGHRRLEAQAWSNLGAAYFKQKNPLRARSCFRESDALANYQNEKHPDLLFFNAFHEWRMARAEINPTREKIAFGRLKALRSSLERSMPEVEAFDAFVERGRSHA
jgi:tetratricopeptide (TPR) repeat protein